MRGLTKKYRRKGAIDKGRSEISRCVHCKSEVFRGASICTSCGKSQNLILSRLGTFASLSGAVTIVSGFIVYMLGATPKIIQELFREQLVIVSFLESTRTHTDLTLFNAGETPIYIEGFVTYLPSRELQRSNSNQTIASSVEPGKYFRHNRNLESNGEYAFPSADGIDKSWRMDNDLVQRLLGIESCFGMTIFDKASGNLSGVLEFMERGGRSLLRVEHEIWLLYYSGDAKEWKEVRLETDAVLNRNKDDDRCGGHLGEIAGAEFVFE